MLCLEMLPCLSGNGLTRLKGVSWLSSLLRGKGLSRPRGGFCPYSVETGLLNVACISSLSVGLRNAGCVSSRDIGLVRAECLCSLDVGLLKALSLSSLDAGR